MKALHDITSDISEASLIFQYHEEEQGSKLAVCADPGNVHKLKCKRKVKGQRMVTGKLYANFFYAEQGFSHIRPKCYLCNACFANYCNSTEKSNSDSNDSIDHNDSDFELINTQYQRNPGLNLALINSF
jgi:hypothetical protein